MKDKLTDLRTAIDALDDRIIQLLNKRAEAAVEIGKIKASNGDAMYVPEREKSVLSRLVAQNSGPLSHASICNIFSEMMESSLALEQLDHVLSGGADKEQLRQAVDFISGSKTDMERYDSPEALLQAIDEKSESVVIVSESWMHRVCESAKTLIWTGCWPIETSDGCERFHLFRSSSKPDVIHSPVSIYCMVDEGDKSEVMSGAWLSSIPARSVEAYEVGNDTQSMVLRFRLQTADPAEVTRLVGEVAQKSRFVWTV